VRDHGLSPTTRYSTCWSLSNLQSSIQSGSIAVIVANPEGVQLGVDPKSFLGVHSSDLGALEALRLQVAGEQADTSIHRESPSTVGGWWSRAELALGPSVRRRSARLGTSSEDARRTL
jgi:hypothetical protein